MERKPLIGVSLIAVILLILTSLTNVVGYQTVQTSQQNSIKERINRRELLFQTIVDIANNREIPRIILKSQMSRGIFPESKIPVITKNQLKRMYFIGLLLSNFITKTKIQQMVRTYQLDTADIQQEINAIIEKDPHLREKITQLANSDCECETSEWGFPVICTTLLVMMGVVLFFWGLLVLLLSPPPSAIDEMLDLLVLMLGPLPALYQRFNCPIPEGNNHPFSSDIAPADGEQNVSLDLTELSFRLTDEDNDLMSYKVITSPDIGKGEGELVPSGTYTIPIYGLQENTNYRWELLLYEGGFGVTPISHKYTFTTEAFTPFILNPSPIDNSEFLPINTSNISFDLVDPQHELMNWTVETQPDIGSGFGTNVTDGRYAVPINDLDYFTKYTWFVNVTDGTYWAKKTFSFRTTTKNIVIIEPVDDATISEPDPNVNFGTSSSIILRSIRTWNLEGLIKFNLSAVPSNVTIMVAGLQMNYYRYENNNPSGNKVNLYRITNDWDEETVTWNNQPSSVAEPSSFAFIPATINNWVFWNVTVDTQMFYNNGTINYGWKIKDMSGDWQNETPYFRSKDYTEYHPFLIIGYE